MSKSNAVAKTETASTALATPSFLKEFAGMGLEGLDNVKTQIPRISLMHPLSSAVTNGEARPGDFCLINAGSSTVIGRELVVVPIYSESGWALWDPSASGNAPLARGVKTGGRWVWNPSHTQFEVTYNGSKTVWDTKGSIEESGLSKWVGSGKGSIAPPAKESINFLFALPDVASDAFGVMSFQKSAFPIAKNLVSLIAARAKTAPAFGQRYVMTSEMATAKNGNKHLLPKISFAGLLDDEAMVREYYQSYLHVKENGLYNNMQSDDNGGEGDRTVGKDEEY